MIFFNNDTITIFNQYYDNSTKAYEYKKTIIQGVNWQSESNSTVNDKGISISENTLVFIDKLEDYVSPKEFLKTQRGFTLTNGDIIVKGNCIENNIKEIKKYYDDVITIKSILKFKNHMEVRGV